MQAIVISLSFDGAAVAIGFMGNYQGGFVDVMIDGVLVETVDTYPHQTSACSSVIYPLTVNGTHTISATLTGAQHPNAGASRMRIDFIDVWDGTSLPATPQEVETAGYFNRGWIIESDAVASGGTYRRSQGEVSYNHRVGNLWIPFEGDSVQFDAIATLSGDPWTQVYVDGVEQPFVNVWNDTARSTHFCLRWLRSGAHICSISKGNATGLLSTP